MSRLSSILCLAALNTSAVYANCETNVDNIEAYYINGMLTDVGDFAANKLALEQFIQNSVADVGFSPKVDGYLNKSETGLAELFEVARQKFEDILSDAILSFLNSDFIGFTDSLESEQEVQDFLATINSIYTGTYAEEDTRNARDGIIQKLNTCSRVVLMTHSQGNFYGNAIFNDIYANYTFPNGYSMASYPMLGMMQIASPVNRPGGAISTIYPDIVGHITNDFDLVMALVRSTIGSVEPNYTGPNSDQDFSGHGLELSYLLPAGQSAEIAAQMKSISRKLYPYPLHGQFNATSSALSGYGYSAINSVLDISFKSGDVYRYAGVSEFTFSALKAALSKGGFFNSNIRDQYSYEQID